MKSRTRNLTFENHWRGAAFLSLHKSVLALRANGTHSVASFPAVELRLREQGYTGLARCSPGVFEIYSTASVSALNLHFLAIISIIQLYNQ